MHEMSIGINVSHTADSTAVPIPVPYHLLKLHYALQLSLSLLPTPTSPGGAASIRTLLTKVKERRVCTHPHSLLWSQHSSFFQTKHQQGTVVHIGPLKKSVLGMASSEQEGLSLGSNLLGTYPKTIL